MQIVKSEYNSQPRKDEETHLRKYESPRKHGTIVKKRLNSSAPLRWRGVVANVMAVRHHGCSGVISGVLAMGAEAMAPTSKGQRAPISRPKGAKNELMSKKRSSLIFEGNFEGRQPNRRAPKMS